MVRAHFKIYFLVEKLKLLAEKLAMRGSVTIVTLTSSDGFAGSRLSFADENEILK